MTQTMRSNFIATLCCTLLTLHSAVQAQTPMRKDANPDALVIFLDRLNDTTNITLDAASTVTGTVLNAAHSVVVNALGLLGVPYRYGGNTAEQGLDCSGFVKLVFQQTTGLILPRRSAEMSQMGNTVAENDLQPGDLVFYNTLRRANSHVGIYIGNGQFVHSPSSGGKVRTENMNAAYWQKRFEGAKRLDIAR